MLKSKRAITFLAPKTLITIILAVLLGMTILFFAMKLRGYLG